MKKLININTFKVLLFGYENDDIIEGVIDCRELDYYTNVQYKDLKVGNPNRVEASCEDKYKKIVQNGEVYEIHEMTQEEKIVKDAELLQSERDILFQGRNIKITVDYEYVIGNYSVLVMYCTGNSSVDMRTVNVVNEGVVSVIGYIYVNYLKQSHYNMIKNDSKFLIETRLNDDINNYIV